MNVFGILVTYSPLYYKSAIDTFSRLMNDISPGAQIVIVNNNRSLSIEVSPGFRIIQGDNVLHEFGAWQLGLNELRKESRLSNDALVVFANDTLCHHRTLSGIERMAFSRGFRKAARASTPMLSGQQSSFKQSFIIQDVEVRSWVCTYLFAMNSTLLESLGNSVCASLDYLSALVPGGDLEDNFFSAKLDPVLKSHLISWLFEESASKSWRRAAPLSASNAMAMRQKAFSILNEKLLTARAISVGARIADPIRQPHIRALKGARHIFRYLSS